jgi:hypothetical protein
MLKVITTTLLILISIIGYSQSVVTPQPKNFTPSTPNQDASGFTVTGFNSNDILLLSIGLINPPSGSTLRLTTTSGITASIGYNLNNNFTRISFTGTQANINNALQSLKTNTGSSGSINITVSVTINPSGYFYLPSNGHFYRPMSWPGGVSGGDGAYNQIKNLASSQTFKGQTGYLVTITSQDEQNFIQANVPGSNILIALTDRQQEGVWRWDAGPESGTIIKTSNSGGVVSGQYNNWCNGEPNNWGTGENYTVTKWGGGNCWNDFGPPASSFPGSISGYVVEFGTWSNPNDQTFDGFYTGNVSNGIVLSQPFNYSGYIYNSQNIGIPSIQVRLLTSTSGQDNFTLYNTYITDSNGLFNISTPPISNLDFRIVVDEPNITTPNINDVDYILGIILNQNTPTSIDYYKSDANESNSISISDVYIIFKLMNNINLTSKSHRYFNTYEWSQILSSTGSSILNIPGYQSIILNNPQNGGSSNYYLIITGKL